MLNECSRLSLQDPNDAQVAPAATYIINRIEDTRSSLKALGFNNVKVGNSDAGSYFNTQVLSSAEYGVSSFLSSSWLVGCLIVLFIVVERAPVVRAHNCRRRRAVDIRVLRQPERRTGRSLAQQA